ncbi:hypothetical protein [Peredibacter starrii]|uniref:Uncharacterized protein n=1 Tax=Peredibacter starrii TaxID=28202 RepID=A0AAX4HP91_9BACT|nr:hypothetical protein [Peredibacter starrii]WPU65129.1 hypothetical protein SOO65_20745 [Peredibacter starrii]
MSNNTFIKDATIYVSRVKMFDRSDWITYIAWVGLMSGLLFATLGFVLLGYTNGVTFPTYVWNVPLGTFIFVGAIAFDTIGHRTVYKEELQKGEALVHHITIFAGISSCLLLCLAYSFPDFFAIPSLVMIALSIFYSVVDEALHWRRYIQGHSDRVEMWSHFFIFVGHLLMILSWWKWFSDGYPGVKETLLFLP